ncbi:MAG: DUF3037 domain-containing protein [Bacteroidota bacterium]
MPAYDYALIRVVPNVCWGDCTTVGAIVQCRQKRFIGVAWREDPARLAARVDGLNADLLARYLGAMERVAAGEGPIGKYPPSERFHWLTATRSTSVQASAVHTGVTEDPAAALAALVAKLG